jgi:hypothetical protein
MSDERGGCPFDLRLSIKIVSRISIHNRHIYRMVLSITGDIARGGKALPSFFSVITRPAFSPESAVTK